MSKLTRALTAAAMLSALAVPTALATPAQAAAPKVRCALVEKTIYAAGAKIYLDIDTGSVYKGGKLTSAVNSAWVTVNSTTGKTHKVSGVSFVQIDHATKAALHGKETNKNVVASATPGHTGYAVYQSGYRLVAKGSSHRARGVLVISGHTYVTRWMNLWSGTKPCNSYAP